ncbi:nuclear transport factor 2 family protein [Hoyosella rhizosphaerae]|uniref:Membrane protein n=1 Tax=Hoyosella rhizosphaerae TaxID=1755582 RepID=A0A916X9L3_9ACTN|nr:nuclear transport factor 2 family protein [Hoyosella rhizosphaerae]MBN4926970.1 nuclear transport factor 2 family protein [Hoyosella rhizosphaerae]GGC55049.1 membrane protein [Hoyosella rhizosphaerae]
MHPFRAAVEANDFSNLPSIFSEDVVFRSPIAHRPYQGRDMVALILGAVTQVFEDFEYEKEISEGDDHALIFRARVGEFELQGCDFLHTNADGLVDEFTVMLRPLKATTAFAEKMGVIFAAAMRQREAGQ